MATHNPYAGQVCLTTLSPEQKRAAWKNIQEKNPALAAMLQGGDPGFDWLKARADKIWVSLTDAGPIPGLRGSGA